MVTALAPRFGKLQIGIGVTDYFMLRNPFLQHSTTLILQPPAPLAAPGQSDLRCGSRIEDRLKEI
jgi:hypothetical protein